MNLHYAKLVNGSLTYAPNTLVTSTGDLILNPKRLAYLQAGYKTLVDEPPVAPRGKSAALTRYVETSDTITAIYKLVPCAVAPRTFSKLKIVFALEVQNLWPAIRDWLVEADYYDLFLAAQDFREDHPSFTEVLNAAKTRFNFTDEAIEQLLAASVADS